MASIGERIKDARKSADMTQEDLALAIGAAGQSTIGNYERGSSDPSLDMLRKIANVTGRSIAWFAAEVDDQLGVREDVAPYGLDTDRFALIPRYEVLLGAGPGQEPTHEQISGSHAYRRDWLMKHGYNAAQLVIGEVDDMSMYPTLATGDIVLINRGERKIQNGKIYAFRSEDGLRLKRLFKQMDGRIRLESDNANKNEFKDEHLTPFDVDAELIGRVVHRAGSI